MDERLRRAARLAVGFMEEDEGLALYEAGLAGARLGPLLEIGSYCGKSALYLGAAAKKGAVPLFSIDHHRGSEEHQVGGEYHDELLVDPATGLIDTLPVFRATIARASLEEVVITIVGDSPTVAAHWRTPLGLVFIDGGHSRAAAYADFDGWAPHVMSEGLLVIHDVFEDQAAGGRPPYEIFGRALDSGRFEEATRQGSLRVLRRVDSERV